MIYLIAMNVVYSTSDGYAEICGISLTSLFENNKDAEKICVYIIDNDVSDKNKNRFFDLAKKYSREIVFLPKPKVEETVNSEIFTGRWNIATFFRLFLSDILPSNVDRVFYIDCDTIVRKSLKNLINLDIGDCLVAGCDDCRSDLYRIDIGEKPGQLYINNGFMIADLDKWRKANITKTFAEFIQSRHGNCTYMDQAPLNGILSSKDLVYELKPIYNSQRLFFDFSYKQILKLRKPTKHLSEEEYNEAITNPVIVHFTPTFLTGTRPWQIKDKHKFRDEFLHYKSLSEWKDEPLRKDDRKFAKKLMTVICKCTPRFILIKIMGYLHATWYPKRRIKLAKEMEKTHKCAF